MKEDSGVTLIELLVVITIATVLIVALGFEFTGWQGKYKVESQIKDIYSDLMNARINAMQKNRAHFVNFPDTVSYTIYDDDSDGINKVPDGDGVFQPGTGDAADRELPTFPKSIENAYTVTIGTTGAPQTFTFNTRGLLSPNKTICIFTDFDGDKISDVNPDYDCIILSNTRINMGKLQKQDTDGGVCRSKTGGGHCEPK